MNFYGVAALNRSVAGEQTNAIEGHELVEGFGSAFFFAGAREGKVQCKQVLARGIGGIGDGRRDRSRRRLGLCLGTLLWRGRWRFRSLLRGGGGGGLRFWALVAGAVGRTRRISLAGTKEKEGGERKTRA